MQFKVKYVLSIPGTVNLKFVYPQTWSLFTKLNFCSRKKKNLCDFRTAKKSGTKMVGQKQNILADYFSGRESATGT